MGAKRIAIVQSNYVPWRGYFDLMASVDEFVLFDDVQYTRRDWRNRNRIKTAGGTKWLTIAAQVKGQYTQTIRETLVADEGWAQAHWTTLRQAYAKADGFATEAEFVEQLYASVPGPRLSAINHHFLSAIAHRLGIETQLTWSMDYPARGVKDERLLDICLKAGATEYVSGPAARAYLDEQRFADAGIAVSWFEYGPYAEYAQVHPPFDPLVSVLDLLLCAGARAPELVHPLQGARR